jgi:hypothetical protein
MMDYDMHLIARPRCENAHPEPGPDGSTGWYCTEGCHKHQPYGCQEAEIRATIELIKADDPRMKRP